MESRHLKTRYYVAELCHDILHVQYKPLLNINLEDAHAIVAQRLRHFGDLDVPVLIKSAKVKSVEKAARSFLFNEGLVNVKAVAFVEDRNMGRIITTFMSGFEVPRVPCQTFDSEAEALTWLRQYV